MARRPQNTPTGFQTSNEASPPPRRTYRRQVVGFFFLATVTGGVASLLYNISTPPLPEYAQRQTLISDGPNAMAVVYNSAGSIYAARGTNFFQADRTAGIECYANLPRGEKCHAGIAAYASETKGRICVGFGLHAKHTIPISDFKVNQQPLPYTVVRGFTPELAKTRLANVCGTRPCVAERVFCNYPTP